MAITEQSQAGTMTSRERVLKALNHTEADRVPFDLGSSPVTGMAASVYIELKKALGIDTPTKLEVGQQIACVEDVVQRRIGCDVRRVGPEPLDWKEWTFNDGVTALIDKDAKLEILEDGSQHLHCEAGARMVMPPNGWFFDIVAEYQPLREATTVEEVKRIFDSLPQEVPPEQKQQIISNFRRLRKANEFATFGIFPMPVFESWFFRGFDIFLMDFLAEPDISDYLMHRHAEHFLNLWRPILEEIGDELDVIFLSDDLGSQNALLVSGQTYENTVKPIHKEIWAEARKLCPNAKLFLHSCGAVEPLIPHFIELGIDVLNPIQVSAKGMDPAMLKKKYGDDLVFWGGGVDTQNILSRATPQKIKDDIKRHIDAMAPGGGFVFATVHDIQPGTPVENFMAMIEAIEEFGKY